MDRWYRDPQAARGHTGARAGRSRAARLACRALAWRARRFDDPRLRAGAIIRLEGLGPSFSGDYRVTSATHTISSSGYRTSFRVRKEIIP